MQIFISYAHADAADVQYVLDHLPAFMRTWIDRDELRAGQHLRVRLTRAITASDCYVIFLSAAALRSVWVKEEIRLAQERQKDLGRDCIIPVALDDTAYEDASKLFPGRIVPRRSPQSGLKHLAEEILKAVFTMLDEARAPSAPAIGTNEQGDRLRVLRKRSQLSPEQWQNMFAKAQERIWLLGHAMLPAVDRQKSGPVIAQRLAEGVDVRLVILDPGDAANHQIAEITREMPNLDLRAKIRTALSEARQLPQQAPKATASPRLSVGVTQATIQNSIVVIDDEFLVTLYSHDEEMGNMGVTLHLKVEDAPDICQSFEREFIWHWAQAQPANFASPLFRQSALRIFDHQDQIENSLDWYGGEATELAPPHLAVVFPTYHCQHPPRTYLVPTENVPPGPHQNLLCANCMFGPVLSGKSRDMDVEKFAVLIAELLVLGVQSIELSGGGEPLHHARATDVVRQVAAARERNPERKFGLISNLATLADPKERVPARLLLDAFSYIRWSWPEDAERDPALRAKYLAALSRFAELAEEAETGTRVGAKVLVTATNASLPTTVVRLVEDLFAAGVDHVKVRTLRTHERQRNAQPRDLRAVLDALVELHEKLRNRRVLDGGKTLEVDLAPRYVSNLHTCRLSTLVTVIEPSGDLRMCWNDVATGSERVIGNVFREGGFAAVWQSSRHREICRTMLPESVCNAPDGCHCRIVGYQDAVERLYSGTVQPVEGIPKDGFL